MTQRLQLASAWRLILCRAFTALLSMAASLALAAPPLPGQIVRVALQLEPPILDPTAGAAAPINEVVYGNVFEGLVSLGAFSSAPIHPPPTPR